MAHTAVNVFEVTAQIAPCQGDQIAHAIDEKRCVTQQPWFSAS